ncbi:MAG: NUDIX hydrolase [Candidatus Nanohaloarchaea archaeon]
MTGEKFRTVVKALITCNGKILIGKKEEDDEHPIGGEWHILGGHLEKGEQMEEAVRREVKEETGLEVEVHQVVDVMTFPWEDGDDRNSVQVLYHCESESMDAEPMEDLQQVEWVEPEDLKDELNEKEEKRLENREPQAGFLEKLEELYLG